MMGDDRPAVFAWVRVGQRRGVQAPRKTAGGWIGVIRGIRQTVPF